MQHTGYKNIAFDCDGTLVKIEGIDELGKMVGKEKEVSLITQLAMNGKIPFGEALRLRLNIIHPKRKHLETVGKRYVQSLVQDAKEVIDALHFLNRRVFIVAGGYEIPILKLATHLNIPSGRVYANRLRFDAQGNYKNLVPGPCAETTGKGKVLKQLRKTGTILFVGDGSIDVACQNLVDCFVGYGGVYERQHTIERAKNYLFAQSLAPLLVLAAGKQGVTSLHKTRFRPLVNKGLRIMQNPKLMKLIPHLSAIVTTNSHDTRNPRI